MITIITLRVDFSDATDKKWAHRQECHCAWLQFWLFFLTQRKTLQRIWTFDWALSVHCFVTGLRKGTQHCFTPPEKGDSQAMLSTVHVLMRNSVRKEFTGMHQCPQDRRHYSVTLQLFWLDPPVSVLHCPCQDTPSLMHASYMTWQAASDAQPYQTRYTNQWTT